MIGWYKIPKTFHSSLESADWLIMLNVDFAFTFIQTFLTSRQSHDKVHQLIRCF